MDKEISNILSVLSYDSDTGAFSWKDGKWGRRVNAYKGRVAGTKTAKGYVQIKIHRKAYLAHRLAWVFAHGAFPPLVIDHINRDKSDNRLINLRAVTPSCNLRNTGNSRANKSHVRGVFYLSKRSKWTARILRPDGKAIELGEFQHFEDAVCARLAGEQCLGFNECDSLSPANVYVKVNIQNIVPSQITPERLIQLMDRDNVPESVRGYMLKMLESQRG